MYKPKRIDEMKQFSRTYLPEYIEYNNEVYHRYFSCGSEGIATVNQLENRVKELKLRGCKVVICNVLSKNLRGKLDIHNKPYTPSQWLFVTNIDNLEKNTY